MHAAPHFPCISLRVGPPAPEAVPLPHPAAARVAHTSRSILSPCSTDTQLRVPRTHSSVLHGRTTCPSSSTGGPPLEGWGHRLFRPQALPSPARGSCRTRLTPLPLLQNVTPPVWGAPGRAPPSVGSASPATARRAASVKVSGCVCSTGGPSRGPCSSVDGALGRHAAPALMPLPVPSPNNRPGLLLSPSLLSLMHLLSPPLCTSEPPPGPMNPSTPAGPVCPVRSPMQWSVLIQTSMSARWQRNPA